MMDLIVSIKKDISDQLAIPFNQSFSSGIFPSILKTSKIILITKKVLNQNVQTIDQFLCYLILTKFQKDLCITDFTTFQKKRYHVFTPNWFCHPTTHTLIHLTDKVRHGIDEGNDACGIFVGLEKAFDTVDHYILLKKLEYYGGRGISNK